MIPNPLVPRQLLVAAWERLGRVLAGEKPALEWAQGAARVSKSSVSYCGGNSVGHNRLGIGGDFPLLDLLAFQSVAANSE